MTVLSRGRSLEDAAAAMILVHGRGATAEDILELSRLLDHPGFVYLAPQAAGGSWYPHSFLAPIRNNEPDLSSGLQTIDDLVGQAVVHGTSPEKIIIGGFSQGACLACEYVARNPRRYGGLLVFSGGLIGPPGMDRDYGGSLDGTPVFIGCSDPDPHVPVERVEESASVLQAMGGTVVSRIYPDMGHTILQDEIVHARRIMEGVSRS